MPNIQNSNFVASEGSWVALWHISWKSLHLFFYELQSLQIWTKKLKKVTIFLDAFWRQIRSSAYNFFPDCSFHTFERLLKALRAKFSCWSFVYTMKSQQEKSEDWKSKKLVVLLLLFKDKYGGVPSKLRTLILLHMKEIELCCNISLGSRCIHFIGASTAISLDKEIDEI